MIIKIFFCSLIFSNFFVSKSFGLDLKNYLKQYNLPENFADKLNNSDVISHVDMKTLETPYKHQKMDFRVLGLHPQNCEKAAQKLGQYESLQKHLDFVKESRYSDSDQVIFVLLKAPILPQEFILNFKLARVRGAGTYPFEFDKGFLKGLKGNIYLDQLQNKQCMIQMSGYWSGDPTGFSDMLFEMFSSTILKLGMERLIRMSRL